LELARLLAVETVLLTRALHVGVEINKIMSTLLKSAAGIIGTNNVANVF